MIPENIFATIGIVTVGLFVVYILPFLIQVLALFVHEFVRRVLDYVYMNITSQSHPDVFARIDKSVGRVRHVVVNSMSVWYTIVLFRFVSHPHESITPETK